MPYGHYSASDSFSDSNGTTPDITLTRRTEPEVWFGLNMDQK